MSAVEAAAEEIRSGVSIATTSRAIETVGEWDVAAKFAPTCVQMVWSCAGGQVAGSCSLSTAVPCVMSARSNNGTATLSVSKSAVSHTEVARRIISTRVFIGGSG
jgi:hypothetical protein